MAVHSHNRLTGFTLINFLRKTINGTQGFTLIELLVVVTIIALFAVISVALFSQAIVKARDSRRMSDVASISLALELYHSAFGQYPDSGGTFLWDRTGDDWIPGLKGAFITEVPHDPSMPPVPSADGTGDYYYTNAAQSFFFCRTDKYYVLTAYLEDHNNPRTVENTNPVLCGKHLYDPKPDGWEFRPGNAFLIYNSQ